MKLLEQEKQLKQENSSLKVQLEHQKKAFDELSLKFDKEVSLND